MAWPTLAPLATWTDSRDTLHMWSQIAGKICLALTPRVNHFWNIAFRVTPRGLASPTMFAEGRALAMTFDFLANQFVVDSSDGRSERIRLEPQSVASFHRRVLAALDRLGVGVRIWPRAVEVPDPIRLDADESPRNYDPAAMTAFWQALVAMEPVLQEFRAEFIGKCSPVHFFWGSFDLAVTRFSGRRAPERPGADSITREAYSHEVISHGFWPGGGAVAEPAFYAYAAPEPVGFKTADVQPAAAHYSPDLSEFILPYDAVRRAPSPEADLMAFLRTTYAAGATTWDRSSLER